MPYHDLIEAIRSADGALADLGDPPTVVLDRLRPSTRCRTTPHTLA